MSKINKIRLSGQTYAIEDESALHDLDLTVSSTGTNAVASSGIYSAITAATAALAEVIGEEMSAKTDVSAFTAHTSDTTIHVTSADKTAWNAKADISDIPSVSGYADSVKFNNVSKYVEFYHGGTGGTKVFEYDASPFLIDGMVQNVEIKDVTISGELVTCLVISFNTDAGKQDINIPITEIFNPEEYVDVETFTAYTASTDTVIGGKASQSDLTTLSGSVTAHTADTTIHVTSSDKTTWSGKQDALVNQVNIKSINGTSLLGSGDMELQSLPTINGTVLVFS